MKILILSKREISERAREGYLGDREFFEVEADDFEITLTSDKGFEIINDTIEAKDKKWVIVEKEK